MHISTSKQIQSINIWLLSTILVLHLFGNILKMMVNLLYNPILQVILIMLLIWIGTVQEISWHRFQKTKLQEFFVGIHKQKIIIKFQELKSMAMISILLSWSKLIKELLICWPVVLIRKLSELSNLLHPLLIT